MLSSMEVKTFKPGSTLVMISTYVIHKGKSLKSVLYCTICKTRRECSHSVEILPLSWSYRLLSLLIKYPKEPSCLCIHRATGNTSPHGVFPLLPILLLVRIVLLLTEELLLTSHCSNSKTYIHLNILNLHPICQIGKR